FRRNVPDDLREQVSHHDHGSAHYRLDRAAHVPSKLGTGAAWGSRGGCFRHALCRLVSLSLAWRFLELSRALRRPLRCSTRSSPDGTRSTREDGPFRERKGG